MRVPNSPKLVRGWPLRVDDLQGWVATMTGYLIDSQQSASELYRVGLESVAFLMAVGDLLIGWLLSRQAEIALAALDGDPSAADRSFYAGKVTIRQSFSSRTCCRG